MSAGTLISAGTVLDGKYEVLGRLGQGGMGAIYRARHRLLHHEVAIKVPATDELTTDTCERLLREARAAAILKSDHVCRVLDVGVESDAPYIVLELLHGRDLGAVLQAHGRLPPALAAAIFVDACDALAEAHARGIVHRDVKPSNVFLARRPGKAPIVKVLDFGISKVRSPELTGDVTNLTSTMAMLGTPSYVSPEQIASSRNVDSRADVWAVGVCLYQAVSGRLPFTGQSLMDLAVRISTEEVVLPSVYTPELPNALQAIILRCLAKDREERFASAAELRDALAPLASTEGLAELVPAPDAPVAVDDANGGGTTITSPGGPPAGIAGGDGAPLLPASVAPRRARRALAIALPLVLGGALASAVVSVRMAVRPAATITAPVLAVSADPRPTASPAEPSAPPNVPDPPARSAPAIPPGAVPKRRARPAPTSRPAPTRDDLPSVR